MVRLLIIRAEFCRDHNASGRIEKPRRPLTCKICIGAVTYLGCIALFAPSTLRKLVDAAGHAFGRKSVLLATPPWS
jgi:hypothetical protein